MSARADGPRTPRLPGMRRTDPTATPRAARRQPDRRGAVAPGYAFEGPALELGGLMLDADRRSPTPTSGSRSAMLNRHGLVAGATGTGKTKTLQLLAEQLSANGVPVFAADIKGDLSGIGAPGRGRREDHRARRVGRADLDGDRRSRSSSTRSAARAPASRCG